MLDSIEVPEVITPNVETTLPSLEPSQSDPRYVEKALLIAAGLASLGWVGLIGWFVWWLVT